jgi:capsular polysaccharide transport system permease protein
MYFTSGTFYVPNMMPVALRDILVWNPVLQGIELFRSSMFRDHEPEWLDINYLATIAVCFGVGGIIVERFARRKLLEIE